MAQPQAGSQTDGMMQMLDPFGFWKTSRDATLEAWSKLMIDAVNSDEYARFTGRLLDQYLSTTQPMQDMVQKTMTYSLAYLNMPTRDEVVSLAERLVNIERRLDDLDDQTYDMHGEDQKGFHKVERDLKEMLNTLVARLDKLEAAIASKPESAEQTKPQRRPELAKEEGTKNSKK